eukprot:TRINITY_DN40626_c0_g1_i1.p1 TRINITY_DN40626_c0_g1~~TRINITY_DN40626_c0_g1_i1.p1  ORF type:complete len:171 (-),score=57.51 TRINITY_DN40626_c0_g1_i1:104-616(-)
MCIRDRQRAMPVGRLGVRRLCCMAFAVTCSGPFGIEAAVRAGGPPLTTLGLLAIPVLYIIPQILMTAELACMMPTNSGYIEWVLRAWGPTTGAISAYNNMFTNLFDNAIYPVLVLEYADTFMPDALTEAQQTVGRHLCSRHVLSLIHISEPTRLLSISYAVFCLKKKKKI